jgi:hypothetical protein
MGFVYKALCPTGVKPMFKGCCAFALKDKGFTNIAHA